jgi:hypothetical protein
LAKVTDDDAGFGTDSKSVDIANVRPTVTLTGVTSANEGDTKHYAYSWTDPGSADTVPNHSIDCGIHGHSSNALFDGATNTGSFDCTWSDDSGAGTADVTASVTDDDGDTGSDTKHVTVANVAPTAHVGGQANVDEGSTHTYAFTVSDPGTDDTFTVDSGYPDCGSGAQYVTGSLATDATGGTFDCFFPDGPASTDVKIKVTDDDGGSDSASQSVQVVQVANVAPDVTVAADQGSNEGSSHSFDLGSFTDPGDDSPWNVSVDWGDGSPTTDFTTSTTGTIPAQSHTYADGPNNYMVTVNVNDGTDTTSKTFSVHVNNVAPTIAISGNASVDEGSSYTLTLGAVTDPGTDTVSNYVVHWGDGSTDIYGTDGAKTHTYADGPSDHAIKVDLADEDGTFTDAANALSVHVNNVAPTVTLDPTNTLTWNESTSAERTFAYSTSDPAGANDPLTITIDCGTGGQYVAGSDTGTSFKCIFADGPASPTVSVSADDGDGGVGSDTQDVTVKNVDPTVTLGATNTYTFDESGTAERSFDYSVSDPAGANDPITIDSTSCGAAPNSVASNSFNASTNQGTLKCKFPDGPDTPSISIDVGDGDGGTGSASHGVTINNVAPTAHLTGAANVEEGSTHTYTFTVTDPGQDDFSVNGGYPDCGTGGEYVDGTLSTNAGGGSFDCFFPDGPANTDVKIKVTDEDGGSDSASESVQVVQVANVAPDVAAATDQSSNEGQNHSFDLGSFTDPGDDSPWTVTVDWGDGSFPYTTFYAATAGTIPAQSHTYGDGPNDYTVTVSVNDGEATTSKTFAVHVNNVAPTVAFTAAPDSANEGQTKHYTYSISDPGVDTVESVATSCGANGTTSNATNTNTSGSFDCTFPDGDASSTVTVQATDSDHDAGNTASQPVTISNVAPTIAISGDSSENEGSSYTLNLGAVTDPGQDTVTQWIVHWGDGQSDTYASDGNVTHTYVDGPGDHTIKVDLTDEDGSFTDAANALSVHVNNVAPTIAVSGNANVDEGSTYTLTLGAVRDPGTDTVSSYLVHWGDGSSNAYSTGGAKTHTYADGPNNYDITVDLTDEDGSFTDAANAFSVQVNNVAPTISISGAANVNEGSSYSLTVGAVNDPGTDTVSSYVVHWGDGSTDTYPTNGVKTHIYADGPNSYKITGDLTDEDGTFTDAANALSVHVNNVAPTAHLAGAANVEEGSTHTYTFTVTDPGQDAYTVDQPDYPTCGSGGHYVTGSLTTNAGGGSFDCFFPDGPASSDVKIKVTDEDGGSDSASESVQVVDVANIPPNVTAPADQSSNEGQNHSFDLGSFTDPGDDSPWTVSVDWGDGSFPLTSFQVTSTGTIPATSHTYSDNGMYTVTVSVNDGEATPSTTFKVTVHNVAPTVHLSGPASTTEGTTESYSYTFTDPGADTWTHTTSCGAHGSLSDDSFDQATKSGSFKCTWADNYLVESVSATVTDDDTGSGSDSKLVDIANVKPMVTLSGLMSANEGDTKSYTYSWTDPGSADTFPSHFVGCGSHGTASSEVFDGIAKTGSFDCTWSDDSGAATSEVTVSVSDDDSGTGGATKHVTVANLAPSTPSLTAPADNSTTTDNTPTFDWSDSTDPAGANDTITYRILVDDNCDFSSPERDVTTGSSGFTPVTALADGTYCWKVSASDDDGGASSDSSVFHLTIDATVPTVVSITRVDASPTNASTVHWTVIFSESVTGVDSSDFALANGGLGGSPAVSGVSGSGTTYTVTASTGTGSGTLGLNLVDNDSIGDGAGNPLGGTGASNGSLTGEVYTIDRSALTVTINQAVGQLDPTSTAPIKFAVVFNKPVTDFNNADVDLSSSTAGGTLIANVYNSGDNKTYEVKVNGMTTAGGVVINVGANKATDAAGNGNQTATIIDNKVTWNPAIGNNTPTAYIDSPPFGSTYAKGTASITLKAHFTDPDNGPWTYTINWDDSTGNSTGSLTTSGQNFQANHSFPNTGVYTINVCVKDSAGASGCAQVWIVVYDPNGGFVTGGGWINVGAGSYAADPTLTGRANFGFNSQYKKNANVPTGETEFNFQVGNFNFHSEAYTWLVVSGYKAQYKGTGSVNGVSGYDFTLTAYDGDITGGGGADMFRIRITKTNNGNVVFDNRNGKPTDMDTADPQVIAGGSIVIHKA